MQDSPPDFGTGLRAHLGLEHVDPTQLDVALAKAVSVMEPTVAEPLQEPDQSAVEALAALESELLERERALVAREAALAGRAGSLLATAQALYDEVLGGGPIHGNDELARLRRRKSGVA